MNTTMDTIRQMIAEEFELDPAIITADATLESLNIDSLSTIEFMFMVEDRFNIDMPEERVKLHTVGDIVIGLEKVIAAQHGKQVAQVAAA